VNLIATANQNTLVNLFNPYVNEPNGVLKGHSRIVLTVKFMPSRSQLISFSADKIMRIWNVPLQICIQRIANIFPKGPDGQFLMISFVLKYILLHLCAYLNKLNIFSNFKVDVISFFDEPSNRYYISFRFTLLMMEIKPEITDRIMTHSNSVVSVRFNRITNQIFTLSQDGTIYVWYIYIFLFDALKIKNWTQMKKKFGIKDIQKYCNIPKS
jgi:WD40 repeat protein